MVTECVHRMRAALVGAALTIHGAAVAGERAPLPAVTAWVMGTGLDLVRLGLCKNAINSSAGDGQKSQLIAVPERRGDGERSFDYGNLLHRDVCGRIVFRHIALASWDNAPVEPAKAAHFEDLQELIDTVLLNHLDDFESVASAIQKGNPPGEIRSGLSQSLQALQDDLDARFTSLCENGVFNYPIVRFANVYTARLDCQQVKITDTSLIVRPYLPVVRRPSADFKSDYADAFSLYQKADALLHGLVSP